MEVWLRYINGEPLCSEFSHGKYINIKTLFSKTELFYLSAMPCSIHFVEKFENINSLIHKHDWKNEMNIFIVLCNLTLFVHLIMSIFKNLHIKLPNFDPLGVRTYEKKYPLSGEHFLPFQSKLAILRNKTHFRLSKVIEDWSLRHAEVFLVRPLDLTRT